MSRDAIREEDFEEVLIEYNGSYFKTMVHKSEKYYVCPLCGIGDLEPIFFSKSDIIWHIKYHLTEAARRKP